MDVSDIQRQLDMGEPIEHEHTKDHKLAMDIALQHLDEFPDYYTRLKKMEADAKKHHKKFKDVKEALDGKSARDPDYSLKDWFNDEWVQTGGKYDGKPCAKQPGQTTKPYCRDPDDRADMSKEERNKRASKKRKEDPNPNRSGKAKMVTQESAGEKDACYKKVKSRYKVWPSAYASGALVKCRKVGAANWGTKSESTNSLGYDWDTPVRERADRYCPKCEKLERRTECKYGPRYWDTFSLPAEIIGSKKDYNITMPHPGNFPEAYDHEYSMARSEISTIIGAAKRLRKKIGKGEGSIEAWVQSKITKAADYLDSAADYVDSGEMKKESVSIEDANGNHYAEFIDIIKPEPLKASKGIGSQLVSEEPGDGYIGPARLGIKNPLASDATRAAADKKRSAGQSKEGGLVGRLQQRADATDAAIKMLNQSYSPEGKSFNQFMSEASPAWQRKEGKNSEGGLNKKGIASYRKENPGSNLSLAVTTEPSKLKKGSKSANRRKSFCSRMSGMKKKLTSAKTANDPNSRINKSLRKWNC
jgi:hypothetical protein